MVSLEPLKIPIVHSIYQGGPLVVLLIMIFIMLLVFVIERYLSLYKVAKGKSSVQVFFKKLVTLIQNDDFDGALAACDKQRGTTANVLPGRCRASTAKSRTRRSTIRKRSSS